MRIYAERGLNNILFELTERKFENKYKKFFLYSKIYIEKFFKRKDKPTGVYIDYTYGYKTKDPPMHYYRHVFPPDMPITKFEILKFANMTMEEYHSSFVEESDEEEMQIYNLRAIQINFVYT